MRLSKLLIGILLFIGSATYAQHSPQDTLTAYYYRYPQQAIKDAEALYRQAIKNNDTPLLIKSLILKTTFTLAIDHEDYPAILSEVEKYLSQETDSAGIAVINSYCAQLYAEYYNNNSYLINQRTPVTDYIPEDIASWSSNIFAEKIKKCVAASLLPARKLQETPLSTYKAILTSLTPADSLRPTLYDFLCYRAINILLQTNTPGFAEPSSDSPLLFAPADEFIATPIPAELKGRSATILQIWQELLRFRKKQANHPAFLATDLDRLEYAKKLSSENRDSLYLKALQELTQKYIGSPFVIEVMAKEANEYVQALSSFTFGQSADPQQLIKEKEKIINFCEKGIHLYPKYTRINLLRSIVSEMKAPKLSLQLPEVIYPEEKVALKLTSQNLDNATLQIYRIDLTTEAYEQLKNQDKNNVQRKVYEKRFTLTPSLIEQDTTIHIPLPEAGLYQISLNTTETKYSVSQTVIATRLFSNSQNSKNQQIYSVYDSKSGKPIPKAKILLYKPNYPGYTLLDTVFTNSRGLAFSSQNLSKQNLAYQVINPENPNGPINPIYRWYTSPTSQNHTTLITDRRIYRPGQTVYYKGIGWKATLDTLYALEGQKYKISFKDANDKEIAQQEVTSNRYGSFTGSFVIPARILNGYFTLYTEKGQTTIEVADYKRPEFEITFHKPTRTYFVGDIVRLEGQVGSFSGVKMANTEINYAISVSSPIFYFPHRDTTIHGITRSNAEGNFEITFKAQDIPSYPSFRNSYLYEIKVKVTDTKGETEEAGTSIPIYSGKATPALQIPEQVNKQQRTAFHISLEEIGNDSSAYPVKYTIQKLVSPKQLQTNLEIKDTIVEKNILEGHLDVFRKDSIFPDLTQQTSGIYLFTVECNQIKTNRVFFLYSPLDQKPPFPTYEWIVREKTTCRPGETARILFGTSVKEAYVRYDIYTSDKLIKRSYPVLSDEVLSIDIPFLKEYGKQIWLYISYVKDKKFFSEIIPIQKTEPDRKLTVETKVFRDHLTPGQSESWKFRVVDAAGKPVTAELLAMMYDASLDKIAPYYFNFQPTHLNPGEPYSWGAPFHYNLENRIILWSNIFKRPSYPVTPLSFSELQTYVSSHSHYRFSTKALGNTYMTGSAKLVASDFAEAALDEAGSSGMPTPEINYRENFQETAFFYPQLQTDPEGYVDISFTIPDATTQWKFTALATTPALLFGQLSETIVTSKPLMVRPNLPRFLRTGDQTELQVTVSNLSDTLQQGKVNFEFFDPANQKVFMQQNQTFRTHPQGSQTLTFQFTVPADIDLLGFRVSAQSGHFSDGEQHLLPVLPTETLITQTLPIYTNQTGKHTFTLKQPNTTITPYRLTFELTENPIWYAVLAIPSIQQPQNENITDLSGAYYVNSITQRIIHANPHIAGVIRSWHLSADDPTLLSKLEQNQELKSILLEASPWVMQAQSETECIQSLVQLFDQNRLDYQQKSILQKLAALQNPTGGWSWFKGMYPSRFMTANVLAIMARANLTGQRAFNEQEKEMQIKALRYLDNEIRKDFETTPQRIGYEQILYLYVRSLYRDIPLGDALKAHKYFIALAQKQWSDFTLYEKALTAVTLNRYGFKQEAQNILKSLRQYAVTNNEQGMYWPNNRRQIYRNSAIQTHVALMEAFYELEGNTPETELMKQWLLRQKQTQNWGNVPSTVDAIYALLLTGKDRLNQSEKVTVELGKQMLPIPTTANPLGYLKHTYTSSEIQPDMLSVEINKMTDSPSWGGLYLQYFEKFDQVEQQKGVLSVTKKLFIEKIGPDGKKELLPLGRQNLKTGDKVVTRLTLSLKQDMDFLYLKDFRAACFEPIGQLSGNQWKFGTVYYEESKDAVTNFFFNSLAKGTYVLEYPVWVNQAGTYQDGIATFQSMYAPEYTAYSEAGKITVTK